MPMNHSESAHIARPRPVSNNGGKKVLLSSVFLVFSLSRPPCMRGMTRATIRRLSRLREGLTDQRQLSCKRGVHRAGRLSCECRVSHLNMGYTARVGYPANVGYLANVGYQAQVGYLANVGYVANVGYLAERRLHCECRLPSSRWEIVQTSATPPRQLRSQT